MTGRTRKRGEDAFARLGAVRARAIVEDRTRRLASRGATGADARPAIQLMCCQVGQNLYGLPLDEVVGVQPFGQRGATPSQHPAALGLVVHGGQIRQALDLAALLGAPAGSSAGGWLVLLSPPLDHALRVDQLPVIADVEGEEDGDERRLRAIDGEHRGKTVVRLSPRELIASAQTLSIHGANAP